MKYKETLLEIVNKAIVEGEVTLSTKWVKKYASGSKYYVDLERLGKWKATCLLLSSSIGDALNPWKEILEKEISNDLGLSQRLFGTVCSIKEAIEKDYLIRVEDLVFAEAFGSLLEQGEYLIKSGYYLAACVVLRAVIEEELRLLCVRNNCFPQKTRPTLGDLNSNLYKKNVFDKIAFKNIDSLAAIGNEAAHNKREIKKEEADRMLSGVTDFLIWIKK